MRRIILISYLFTLLLVGGSKMHANVLKFDMNSIVNVEGLSVSKVQYSNLYPTFILIEYTDFDLDEEYSGNADYKSSKTNQCLQTKNYFLENWNKSNSTYSSSNTSYIRYYLTKPVFGLSTPIYIAIRVLRI